jgi:hypothetical protein
LLRDAPGAPAGWSMHSFASSQVDLVYDGIKTLPVLPDIKITTD